MPTNQRQFWASPLHYLTLRWMSHPVEFTICDAFMWWLGDDMTDLTSQGLLRRPPKADRIQPHLRCSTYEVTSASKQFSERVAVANVEAGISWYHLP